MQIRRLMAITAATAALTTLVAGCGDTEDDSADEGAASTETTMADEAGGGGGEEASSSLEFTSQDIKFTETEATGAAGDLDVTLTNEGQIEHSWLVEEHEDDLRLHVAKEGDTDEGTITLEAGEYTFYCDIPGHREAGMEGTLTVK